LGKIDGTDEPDLSGFDGAGESAGTPAGFSGLGIVGIATPYFCYFAEVLAT
jgi:hypothetical protein